MAPQRWWHLTTTMAHVEMVACPFDPQLMPPFLNKAILPVLPSLHPVIIHILLLLLIGNAWGSTIALATIATSTGRAPIAVAFATTAVSVLLLGGWMLLRRIPIPRDRGAIGFFLVTGLLGTALPAVGTYYVAQALPASIRAIVFALIPMITLGLSVALAVERLEARRLLGLLLGLGAVAVLVVPDLLGTSAQVQSYAQLGWIVVATGVATSYALENVYIGARRPAGMDTGVALFGMHLAALVMLLLVVWVTGTPLGETPGWNSADAAVALIGMINIGAYAGFLLLIGHAGPVYASQLSYVLTPAGILWGALILAESISGQILISLLLVLAGLALTKPAPTAPRDDPAG